MIALILEVTFHVPNDSSCSGSDNLMAGSDATYAGSESACTGSDFACARSDIFVQKVITHVPLVIALLLEEKFVCPMKATVAEVALVRK